MADITAFKVKTGATAQLKDTGYLDRLFTHRGANQRLLRPPARLQTGKLTPGLQPDLTQPTQAHIVANYYADLYKRIIVIPHTVNLGAISTEQVFNVQVWNANRSAVKLLSVSVTGGEGIELIGIKSGTFNALSLKKWQVNVGMNGSAVIDCVVTFNFLGKPPVTLHIIGSRSTDWQFFPDWSDGLTENLEFLTRVHQSVTGAEQRIARRLSPRRTFEFKVAFSNIERQRFENALYAYGSRVWSMPIFTDCAYLLDDIKQGQSEINIKTAGYDFSVGGRAILMTEKRKEMVEISALKANKITIKRPIVGSFDRTQTQVYPLRSAVLTDMPQVRRLSDNVSTAQIRLQLHEHNSWSDDVGYLPRYRHHPVLEPTSAWSEDITVQYARLIQTLDNETGLPHYLDTANKAMQITAHRFIATGREEQRKLRNLFYFLRGRQRVIWVATSSTDVTPTSDILGKTLDIVSINYTGALQKQTGRQDIRIECTGGRIFYRRIRSSNVVDSQTERLALDGDAINIKQNEILKISFLTLSRLESDTVSWVHHTDADGTATVTVSFRGLRDELETSL
ncbi:phage tail protein [Rodentibacter sp. Ppn85]|uniref:phage tail protein n=1 Tax=Rodentibacter sp. Ppn85 TaxID=1908525 RepID=UPI00098633B6|nr:phage tail protein [Rodentibacter sp. Ppn85]OOF65122.1 phage tail protein [Rodentibacter sp. Ppn85]